MEEIKESNQVEANETRLAYDPPELRKHGTINDMVLTTNSGSTPEANSSPYMS